MKIRLVKDYNMFIKKGTKIVVKHSRSGMWNGVAWKDFDTEKEEFYPIELDQEESVYGMNNSWEKGDHMPARKGLCEISIK